MTAPRIVVVTGAAGGIGSACVSAFQDRGYLVLGVDLEATSSSDEHLALDLARADCGRVVAEFVGGRPLAGLVNNAALALYRPISETTVEDFDRVAAVNLRAPFLVSQALHGSLEAGAGSVVNVASVHAEATSVSVAAYAAAKGGLVALTRAMAIEWAPHVRVNAVLPGAIGTQMLRDGLFRTGATIEGLGARHPLGRIGTPQEVAEAVLFLVDGGTFITGATLRVDGGAVGRLSTE